MAEFPCQRMWPPVMCMAVGVASVCLMVDAMGCKSRSLMFVVGFATSSCAGQIECRAAVVVVLSLFDVVARWCSRVFVVVPPAHLGATATGAIAAYVAIGVLRHCVKSVCGCGCSAVVADVVAAVAAAASASDGGAAVVGALATVCFANVSCLRHVYCCWRPALLLLLQLQRLQLPKRQQLLALLWWRLLLPLLRQRRRRRQLQLLLLAAWCLR